MGDLFAPLRLQMDCLVETEPRVLHSLSTSQSRDTTDQKLEMLKKQSHHQKNSINNLTKESKKLEDRIAGAEGTHPFQTQQLDELENQTTRQQITVSDLQRENKTLKERLREMEDTIQSQVDQIENLRKRSTHEQTSNNDFQRESESRQDRLQEKGRTNQDSETTRAAVGGSSTLKSV